MELYAPIDSLNLAGNEEGVGVDRSISRFQTVAGRICPKRSFQYKPTKSKSTNLSGKRKLRIDDKAAEAGEEDPISQSHVRIPGQLASHGVQIGRAHV